MTRVKSISADAEQFAVDFEDVLWGQPAAIIIDKPSRTIRVVFKKKERGQQKIESFNFDDIVSFRVDFVGTEGGSYYTIVLVTTIGRCFRLIPVSGMTSGMLKEDVVRDLFTRMNAYIPATRQLPIMSKRQVVYPETSDGSSVARIKNVPSKAAILLFFAFISLAIFTIAGGLVIVSVGRIIEGSLVAAISIPFFSIAIDITMVKSIIIHPEIKQLSIERCWCWRIRRRSKPVPFSGIASFKLFVLGQKCYVRMQRTGSSPPVTLLMTAHDSAEARGIVDWLQEHVHTSGSRAS